MIYGLTSEIWHTFQEASPYVLFGTFLAGVIQVFFDKEKVAKYLGQRSFKSVLLAALGGIPLPLCSCGVLPAAMSLRKSGASKGSTLSFLISTPETGVDSIALSFALLDPIIAVFRPIAAFLTALMAGIIENIFGKPDEVAAPISESASSCCLTDKKTDSRKTSYSLRWKQSMRAAFIDLLSDISKWFLLGIVIAGTIAYFVPSSVIENYLGEGFLAMLTMLLIGIPLYICASASTPIAATLIAKGMSPGVALVFLLAGPATNIAGILVVGKFLGKRAVVVYLLAISVCSILFGLLLNQVYAYWGIDPQAAVGRAAHVVPHSIKTMTAAVLLFLMANALRHKSRSA